MHVVLLISNGACWEINVFKKNKRSAVAEFPPEYSDRNMIVKTECMKQMWLSGKCRASVDVSVSSKTQLA